MGTCFLSEKSAKKSIRRITFRNDLVDASCYLNEPVPGEMPVLLSYRLVSRLNRLGVTEGFSKLKQVVSRGIEVAEYNRNKKGNFVVDQVPQEFFAIQRYYGNDVPSLVIDCVPLDSAMNGEQLRANG